MSAKNNQQKKFSKVVLFKLDLAGKNLTRPGSHIRKEGRVNVQVHI